MAKSTVNKDNEQLAEAFNQYIIEFAEEWQEPLKKELELEMILDTVYTEDTYAEKKRSISGIIQAYQPKFTAKGEIKIGSRQNKLDRMKLDLEFDEDDTNEFWSTKYPQYDNAGLAFQDNPFIQDFLGEFVFDQWKREMRAVAVKGQKVAPTVGVAGSVLGAIDGFNTMFTQEIALGNVQTIATGVITPQNVLDVVRATLKQLDPELYDESINIFMPPEMTVWFSELYKDKRPFSGQIATGSNVMKRALYVEDFNATIIPIKEMRGMGKFWIDVKINGKTNMIVGKHKTRPDMPVLHFVPLIRGIQMKGDWHRFYGLRRTEYTFVTKVA